MTTFSYTTGNPSNLTAGATANMNDIQGPFTDLRTFVNGSVDGDNLSTTAGQQLGLSSSSVTRRGKSLIATSETRANVAYGTLTTPDQVSVVLPTDGLLYALFQATWKETSINSARAALFVGANQQKVAAANGTTAAVGVNTVTEGIINQTGNPFKPLYTTPIGLTSASTGTTSYSVGDVTTGQAFGSDEAGGSTRPFGGACGPCIMFAAAGTYTVSVQFKSSDASTVTVLNRKLFVWTQSF
jgi:hypothetical protein